MRASKGHILFFVSSLVLLATSGMYLYVWSILDARSPHKCPRCLNRASPADEDNNNSTMAVMAVEEYQKPAVSICKNTFIQRHGHVVATMLSDSVEQYGIGALKLLASIQRRRDVASADFLLLEIEGKAIDIGMRQRLQWAGWRFCTVDKITAREPVFPRFADQFTKLHLWRLVEYERVVYLDSDCVVVGSLAPLLRQDLGDKAIGVSRDISGGVWQAGFNMGVFVIKPDVEEYSRLLGLKETVQYDTMMSEQGFLNAVYAGQWHEIGFVNNANLAAYLQDRGKWDSHADKLNVIHYTMAKPFNGFDADYAGPFSQWAAVDITGLSYAKGLKRCPITFVTSYFRVDSKHSHGEYDAWMRNILGTSMCLVIFTDETSRFELSETRLVKVVDMRDEIRVFNQTTEFWERQLAVDSERSIHRSYELYWIWNLKSVFLNSVAVENPFASEYFFWLDIGCVREPMPDFDWGSSWPPAAVMREHERIFVGNPYAYESGDNAETSFEHTNRLAGAIWGGHAAAIPIWTGRYMTVFRDYVEKGRFVGKDQSEMSTVCVRWPDMCRLVVPQAGFGDIWFAMLPFLMGRMPLVDL